MVEHDRFDKIAWVLRQIASPVAESATTDAAPTTNEDLDEAVQETKENASISDPDSSPAKRGDSTSSSDVPSESENDYVSVAQFDVLWRSDFFLQFNDARGGSIKFKVLLDDGDFSDSLNWSQPALGKKYFAIFEMGGNECIYRCDPSDDGMAWVGTNLRAYRRNKTFKEQFDDSDIIFEFPDDMVDDDGVPMLLLIMGSGIGSNQQTACWAKMRDNVYESGEATLSDDEIAKIKVYEELNFSDDDEENGEEKG